MKNNYTVPNAEILLLLTKKDILTSSPGSDPDPETPPPSGGVEDGGIF